MISSNSNTQIKNIVKLLKSSKARREQNSFIIEGIRMFREIPARFLRKAYVTEEFYENNRELFYDREYELVSERIFKEVSETKTPQGVLAIVKQPKFTVEGMLEKGAPLLVILENLQDPGNLGTIIRTCEGAGVSGVIMTQDTVDIYNPKVIRSTMGSIFRMPFCYVENLDAVLDILKNRGITTYAAHLEGNDFYEVAYKKGSAFFIGNEGNGLTDELSGKADRLIKIPMCGQVESLNAAVATTVIVYEAMRQRRL